MSSETDPKPRPARGIYLLPNLVTIAGMFAGFYAAIAGLKGAFEYAVIAIFLAILLDGLDGRIARWTHTESEFGAQLDSLADMLSFGIAPSIVLYSWSLSTLGKPGWLAAFIYTVCTALRLARFNIQLKQPDKQYFQGLATPAAAALVASLVWTCSMYGLNGHTIAILMAVLAVVLGVLKVSTIRYRSFKEFGLKDRVPFVVILMVVLALALIAIRPPEFILILTTLYALSGPVTYLWTWKKRHAH
jgi:CDP-diacylglycerol--serine O-phosphatidyltransferase